MTRLKVHHMCEGGTPQAAIAERCDISLRSVERILSEPPPTKAEVAANEREGSKRRGRPPKADATLLKRVRELLEAEPEVLATEVLRRSREWGFTGSKSAMSAIVKRLRPAPKKEPLVRFDGLPGEYAQFDFGVVRVRYADGTIDQIRFFVGRLKHSRFIHVVIVRDEKAETLNRALIACLEAFGGSPKEWVFDNPKTVRVSPIGIEPVVLHPYLRDLVATYRVIPTLCAPRSGNQKGSVERGVGFSKHSFFLARTFQDRDHVVAELPNWLREINFVRPSSATGVIPAVALRDEAPWLSERPVRVSSDDWPLRETVTVTPMGTVSFAGTAYFASATRLGAPATLFIRKNTVEIVVADRERCVHQRRDGLGLVQRLPNQRQDMLAAIHGRRKIATFRRQCLLELGRPAWSFLSVLVHRCPSGRWEGPCSDLYELLLDHGDDALRDAFEQCVAARRFDVGDVRDALGVA